MTLDFNDRPRLVFWETTIACPLACVHCRATAQRERSTSELDTNEGMRLIDELAQTVRPRPILVFTGGDCLVRDDIVGLAAYAHSVGVPVAIAPSVSPSLNAGTLRQLRAQGVKHVSLSLDGNLPQTHEGVRQIPGHFGATMEAIDRLQGAGFHVQINTTVMRRNAREMADLAALLYWKNVRIWEVFFLINTGRGTSIEDLSARESEDICHFLVDASRYGIVVRTVEAPFFRRVQQQRARLSSEACAGVFDHGELYPYLSERLVSQLGAPQTRSLAPTVATRDGKGIIFVAHNGDVYPSGFLPLKLGNVREGGLMRVYREHPLLKTIRAADFTGECGRCNFSDLCGGSRSRAYAAGGDALGDDPACVRVAAAAAVAVA